MTTILIVDDDKPLIESMERLLRKKGYQVLTARDGEEALKLMETEQVTLVVTDYVMPFMDGAEMVRVIRNRYPQTPIPVIMVSSIRDEKSRMECYDAGVDVYLNKPVTPGELVTMIQHRIRMS